MSSPAGHKLYRFGSFEVDPNAGEVRKRGVRIRVQDQPLLLLMALLERPGMLITREELHGRLWADDTFVDFENGLNTAAARLRQALGDSARTPRFIESVPRRGYRFIAAVETVPEDSRESSSPGRGAEQQEATAIDGQDGDVRKSRRARLLVTTGLVMVSLAVSTWLLTQPRNRPRDLRPIKFSLMAPEGRSFVQFDSQVLSPDGRLVAFPATDTSGDTELWIRPLDELTPRRLEGTKGASFPFWSPDNRSIAFFADGKLKRVDIAGGAPRVVCDAADGRGGSWNRDGIIMFSPSLKSPLMLVAAGGGEPKQLTSLDTSRNEVSHRWPYFLPDGRHFLYVIRTLKPADSGVYLGSITGEPGPLLLRTLSNAIYANDKPGSGYLLFVHDGTLVARPFDTRRLRITGAEFPIAESINVAFIMEPLRADFSASDTGVLAYRTKRGADQLAWFDRKGARLETVSEPGIHLDVTLSPNDHEISFSRLEPHSGRYDIWRLDRASGVTSRVTYGPKDQVGPVWSPDSTRLSFASANLGFSFRNPDRSGEIYETASLGGDPRLLLKSDNLKVPWSSNGSFLLYHEIHSGKKIDTWALPIQNGGKPIDLLQGRPNQLFAVFSPDGKWVAYTSDESGKQEVYVRRFVPGDALSARWMVSNGGGSHPEWPGDGQQIYYLAPDKRIMVVPVSTTEGRFRPGVSRTLFQSDIIDDFRARFAVTSDGQRFLIPIKANGAGSTFATIIVNWPPRN